MPANYAAGCNNGLIYSHFATQSQPFASKRFLGQSTVDAFGRGGAWTENAVIEDGADFAGGAAQRGA